MCSAYSHCNQHVMQSSTGGVYGCSTMLPKYNVMCRLQGIGTSFYRVYIVDKKEANRQGTGNH